MVLTATLLGGGLLAFAVVVIFDVNPTFANIMSAIAAGSVIILILQSITFLFRGSRSEETFEPAPDAFADDDRAFDETIQRPRINPIVQPSDMHQSQS